MTLPPAVAACRLAVRRTLSACAPGDVVLVACSGGADSLALLAATVFEGTEAGLRVVGVTVDHGLQEGSGERAAAVVLQMAALGASETASARVTVTAAGQGPEAAAREARYQVLSAMAARFGSSLVLLGHTLDDQAETVLLGLTRGSGARSLQGMRASYDEFVRPFLSITRTQTELACLAEGITWWVDPHNLDAAYTRSRLRAEVMPVLEAELGPGVARALARTASQLRDDVAYLDDIADQALESLAELNVDQLGAMAPAVRRRVLRLAAVRAGAIDAELSYEHVLAIDALITDWRGQKWIDLPGHVRARRHDGRVVFENAGS